MKVTESYLLHGVYVARNSKNVKIEYTKNFVTCSTVLLHATKISYSKLKSVTLI